MERVDIKDDGVVPTANTLALFFNGLPSVGLPIRMMTYDLHTLQNRFFLTGNALASLHTAIPLVYDLVKNNSNGIDAIAFPDEGAHKRFGTLFKGAGLMPDDIIICSKVRKGNERVVTISDGIPQGKHVLIIDDQTKSGGTLIKCALALKAHGNNNALKAKTRVSAFVTHAICTDEFWSTFVSKSGKIALIDSIEKFYTTDSVPGLDTYFKGDIEKKLEFVNDEENGSFTSIITNERIRSKIEVLPLAELVLLDL